MSYLEKYRARGVYLGRAFLFSIIFAASLLLYPLDRVNALDSKLVQDVQIESEIQENRISLSWRAPSPKLVEGQEFTDVKLGTLATLDRPGYPRVPYDVILLAVPPETRPSLRVVSEKTSRYFPSMPLEQVDGETVGEFRTTSPRENISLEILGTMRGVTLAALHIIPVKEAQQGWLEILEEVELQIEFVGAPAVLDPRFRDDATVSLIRSQVINPEHAYVGKVDTKQADGVEIVDNALAIEILDAGVYTLTYDDLAAYNFLSVDPENLRLTHGGVEVPILFQGDDDSAFESDERILFFANPGVNRFDASDVYMLQGGSVPGLRMQSQSVSPNGLGEGAINRTAFFEENQEYTPNCYCFLTPTGWDGDRWVWKSMSSAFNGGLSTTIFSVDAVSPTRPASVTLWLVGRTSLQQNPDHLVNVAVNGRALDSIRWDGRTTISQTIQIPSGVLKTGTNRLDLSLPSFLPDQAVHSAWLDAFEIQFEQDSGAVSQSLRFFGGNTRAAYRHTMSSTSGLLAFDITDVEKPTLLTDYVVSGQEITIGDSPNLTLPRTYYFTNNQAISAPASIRSVASLSGKQGDYIIIAPSEFFQTLAPMVTLRTQAGHQVVLEDLQAIFDTYGHGRSVPEAIRAYLKDAYDNWSTPPAYVLLVGDGNVDPKQYLSSSFETIIPPYFVEVDPEIGETASDNRFVAVDGDDTLPDIHIGRLPVQNTSELSAILNKIIAYETSPPQGTWRSQITFIADNNDSAGDFHEDSQAIVDKYIQPVRPAYTSSTIFLTSSEENDIVQAKSAIQNIIDQGSSLLIFNGHSSVHQWTAEKLIHINELGGFSSNPIQPIILEMTCLTGSYHLSSLYSLDEGFLLEPDGGAIAIWGPTGLGLSTGHTFLADGFFESVIVQENKIMGPATSIGKLRLAADAPWYAELVDTFVILGDPALNMKIEPSPFTNSLYLPLIMR